MTRRNIAAVTKTVMLFVLSAFAANPSLSIKLAHNTACEQRTRVELEQLASQYDLTKYTLTRDIIIEQGARAHSFPTLTMNCWFQGRPDLLLSQYVHEQGHWVIRNHNRDRFDFIQDLKRVAPGLPTHFPEGGNNEQDTYGHLADNLLEWQALDELIGPERARRVIEWKKNDHYTAIYAFLLAHRDEVEQVLRKYKIAF